MNNPDYPFVLSYCVYLFLLTDATLSFPASIILMSSFCIFLSCLCRVLSGALHGRLAPPLCTWLPTSSVRSHTGRILPIKRLFSCLRLFLHFVFSLPSHQFASLLAYVCLQARPTSALVVLATCSSSPPCSAPPRTITVRRRSFVLSWRPTSAASFLTRSAWSRNSRPAPCRDLLAPSPTTPLSLLRRLPLW